LCTAQRARIKNTRGNKRGCRHRKNHRFSCEMRRERAFARRQIDVIFGPVKRGEFAMTRVVIRRLADASSSQLHRISENCNVRCGTITNICVECRGWSRRQVHRVCAVKAAAECLIILSLYCHWSTPVPVYVHRRRRIRHVNRTFPTSSRVGVAARPQLSLVLQNSVCRMKMNHRLQNNR